MIDTLIIHFVVFVCSVIGLGCVLVPFFMAANDRINKKYQDTRKHVNEL